MIKVCSIFAVLLLLCSCSRKEEKLSSIDWGTELIGVGYIGKTPDSLRILFSYFPHNYNQPEPLNKRYKVYPKISGDTITIQNIFLHDLFRNSEVENSVLNNFSRFLIREKGNLYKLTKLTGANVVPKVLYFKKYPNKFPEKFNYQMFDGMNALDSYAVEINGKDSIKVWLYGTPYHPYLYEQYTKNTIDDLFIGSYLNLICENRYDTTTIAGTIFCGTIMNELLVYNDSIFEYNTYFRRFPDGGILLDYFRSKIDSKQHGLNEFNLDIKSPFKPKKYKNWPVAVENQEILAPPSPN